MGPARLRLRAAVRDTGHDACHPHAGRGADTVSGFFDWVDDHNSDTSRIKEVCIGMSGAYIAGVSENLTEAEIT